MGGKTFRFGHYFSNDSSGTLAATFDVPGCMFDLKARRALTIPDPVRAKAQAMTVAGPPH